MAPCLFLVPFGWMLRKSLCVLGFQVAYLGQCPFLVALSQGCLVRSVLEVLVCAVGNFGVGLLSIRFRIGLRYFVPLNGYSLRRCALCFSLSRRLCL